ncbi:MAG: winged helix-turn-helix domain-containing protein, partial [Spirochaetia bacterium]|nr:winged helix-turn-helix domain-containing protein [Spirochaetia bacterium]
MERKRLELVQQLKSLIQSSSFSGKHNGTETKLPPERELAQSLGVSRNLLREAMITLEAMGYIEIRERQGAFISNPYAE